MIAPHDLLVVAGTVAAIAAAASLAGVWAVRLLADRPVATLIWMVATVTMVTSLASVVVITKEMVLNAHDRDVVLTVVAIAGVAGFAAALLIGRRVARASRLLLGAVRELGTRGQFRSPDTTLPAEFAALSTELVTAYERLARAQVRERTLEASRRELVAWVSHDLRAPLGGLKAMAEALEDEVVTDASEVSAYHRKIRCEADHLSSLIDDLFELSRIHSDTLPLDRQRVGLGDLIAEAIASGEPLARAKGVRLRGSAVPGVPVRVDAAEFGRALRNLVGNAIRHTPSNGPVDVIGAAQRGLACVCVSDSCGGISTDALSRVFDVGFRGEAARTPQNDGGAGLGLPIARGIVEAHGGKLTVRNAETGCVFTVEVPLDSAAAPAQ